MTARIWALGLAARPLVACKPKAESRAPQRDVHGWTLGGDVSLLVRTSPAVLRRGHV